MLNKKINTFVIFIILAATNVLAQTTFKRITTGPLVNNNKFSISCSWVDYNNDGYLDLYVTNHGITINDGGVWRNSGEKNLLFQNNGDPGGTGEVTFTPITTGDIVNDVELSNNSSWGDYNNDGWIDLFVANGGGFSAEDKDNFLYRNNGALNPLGQVTFTRISTGDVVSDIGRSFGSSWGDYDNDGYLYLFVANVSGINFLFHNNGIPYPGSVEEQVTFSRFYKHDAISEDNYASFSCSWGDYDNDGDLDLFVANVYDQNNYLYQNSGDGSFARITSGAIANDGGISRGSSWGDYDNDGDLDLFVANKASNNFLYENNGDPDGSGQVMFTRITSGAIVNNGGNSFGSCWGDYDNDGDLDLFVANLGENNFLYQNDGDPGGTGQVTFTRLTSGEIVNNIGDSQGCCWGDFNRDGFLDLYVANGYIANGSELRDAQNNFLYQNDGNNNNWINLKCVGTFSNRSAIGTKVKVKAIINGNPVQQLREISAQTGFAGQNSLNVAFGLGDASMIDTIQIAWPSGRNQLLTNIETKQFLLITETVFSNVQDLPQPEVNNEIVVSAKNTSGFISEVNLSYRRGGVSDFTTEPMPDQGGGLFQGTIPASEVTATGLEYRMVVVDNEGISVNQPLNGSYPVRVHIPDGVSTGQAQPHGSAQNAYRIFSVPLDLDNKAPAALLEDDLGEYNDTRWRFTEHLGDNNYLDFPDITKIVPGKGYWFLVNEPARVIDSGSGNTITISEKFAVTLSPGWNLIGNPFYFPIPIENLQISDGSLVKLRTYTGAWNDPVADKVEQILPWEGYAIENPSSSDKTLFINPTIASSSSQLAKKDLRNSIKWTIKVLAQCQLAKDVDNIAGVGKLASIDWDQSDLPEPPGVGEYVSVYFPHSDWGQFSQSFCTDIRPEFSKGEEWEFEIKTNIHDVIYLSFEGLVTVPPEYDIWLVDKTLKITHNLRQSNNYSVAGGTEKNPKRLSLVVGKKGFLQEKFTNLQVVPTNYGLSQNYPNPFNPTTTIQYGLPSSGKVSLTVYNILGKKVKTLVNNEFKETGYHAVVWDGRNSKGNKIVSGVYFIRMQTENFGQIRKMVLVE